MLSVAGMVRVIRLRMPARTMSSNVRCGMRKLRHCSGLQKARVMRNHADRTRKRQRALYWQQAAQQQEDQVSGRHTHVCELNTDRQAPQKCRSNVSLACRSEIARQAQPAALPVNGDIKTRGCVLVNGIRAAQPPSSAQSVTGRQRQ